MRFIILLICVVATCPGNAQIDKRKIAFQTLSDSPSVTYDFQYGNLVELYPTESYSEITARREYNWNLLKSLCNAAKISGELLRFPDRRIEFYRPINDQIEFLNTNTLRMFNYGTDMVFYPFTFRSEVSNYSPFKFQYGARADLRNTQIRCAQKQGKFETYDVIIKKGANPKLLEITSPDVRPGFWSALQIGDQIYATDSPADLADSRFIAAVDSIAKTITVTVDFSAGIGNDVPGLFCRNFNESISEVQYNQYGEFWINNPTGPGSDRGQTAMLHIPATSSGAETYFNFDNVFFQNWWYGVSISSGNFHVTFNDLTFDNTAVGISCFARSQINGQSLIGTNMNINENGYLAVAQITFDPSLIYGSGGYIHPTVILEISGKLLLTDNICNGFRQYSASLEDQAPYITTIDSIVSINGNPYDFYTSNAMPVYIDYLSVDDLRVGGTVYVQGGEIRKTLNGSVNLEPPDGTPCVWEFNNVGFSGRMTTAYNDLTEAVHEIYFNDCTFYASRYDTVNILLTAARETALLQLNNCTLTKKPGASIPTYVPGEAIPAGADCSYLFYDQGKRIEVNGLVTDYLKGTLISQSPNTNIIPPYNSYKIVFTDSQINTSELINTSPGFSGTNTYRTDQIEAYSTSVTSFAYNYLGYYLPLLFNGKNGIDTLTIAATPQTLYVGFIGAFSVSGVLYTDMEHDKYYVNAGTINHIALKSWEGTHYITSAAIYSDTITIHALGGDVILNGFDPVTNEYGNIASSVTIPTGDSLSLVCNHTRTFSKSANLPISGELLATGDGTKSEYFGPLQTIVAANNTFTITAGSVTGTAGPDGQITGAGISAGSYIDYFTASYYVLFDSPVANGTPITADYEIYNNWRVTGVYEH